MKAKAISTFAQRFGVQISLNPDFVVERNARFYLINERLKPLLNGNFFVAGLYMGKAKEGKFFPSFNLLNMLAAERGNRVVVDAKAAWLFICGRDIFAKGICRFFGSTKKNSDVLVQNEYGECLGFGRIVGNLSGGTESDEIAVRNVSDVGDFLRRER